MRFPRFQPAPSLSTRGVCVCVFAQFFSIPARLFVCLGVPAPRTLKTATPRPPHLPPAAPPPSPPPAAQILTLNHSFLNLSYHLYCRRSSPRVLPVFYIARQMFLIDYRNISLLEPSPTLVRTQMRPRSSRVNPPTLFKHDVASLKVPT